MVPKTLLQNIFLTRQIIVFIIRKTDYSRKEVSLLLPRNPEEASVYEMYYDFEEPVKKLAGHRVLALNRGEKEKILTVKINAPEEEILKWLERQVITKQNPVTTSVFERCCRGQLQTFDRTCY